MSQNGVKCLGKKRSRKSQNKDSDEPKGPRQYAKGWILTYPQCPLTKERVLDLLKANAQAKGFGISEYIVAEEKHKDGSPHLHAFIKYDKRIYFENSKFDLIESADKKYHGNYQIAKSWHRCEEYCAKEGQYITNINIEAAKAKKAKMLTKEDYVKDPLTVLEEGKIKFMQLNQFIKNQETYMTLKAASEKPKELIKAEKRCHHWYWGGSNTGKTTLLRQKMFGPDSDPTDWFQIPSNNDWKGYRGQHNLYADEFKGQVDIQTLNKLCDGGCKVNTKGGTVTIVYETTVWVFSNYSIERCYHKAIEKDPVLIDALRNRFIVTELMPNWWKGGEVEAKPNLDPKGHYNHEPWNCPDLVPEGFVYDNGYIYKVLEEKIIKYNKK